MQNQQDSAQRLVFSVISGSAASRNHQAQELPSLTLVGAAIARSARLAASNDRARVAHLGVANTEAAGLLRPSQDEMNALFADLNPDEGRIVPPTDRPTGFLWRFHPAPVEAGSRIASQADGATYS